MGLWTAELADDGKRFVGLYGGIRQVALNKRRQPEGVLAEWLARTRYRREIDRLTEITAKVLEPAIESRKAAACERCAKWLLTACDKAGIRCENRENLVLSEENLDDYINWGGDPLNAGDVVRVINPAWYQNGILLDQGHCAKDTEVVSKS